MNENIENITEQPVAAEQPAEYDVISEVNKIKENMVNKTDYDRLRAERDKYAKALIEGTKVNDQKTATPVEDLRKKLFNNNNELSNLEYVSTALELRNAILETSGEDIFVGKGSKLTPDDNDYIQAQKVADAFSHCIEVADGNSEVFTRELMRITEDVKLPRKPSRR